MSLLTRSEESRDAKLWREKLTQHDTRDAARSQYQKICWDISVSKLWGGNFLGQGVKVWASHLCLWQAGSWAWPGRDSLSALSASWPGPPLPDIRHCPILSIGSNLTSAQKKAKKPMKEARVEADIAALQRFWVKSAIGRFIRRDCS